MSPARRGSTLILELRERLPKLAILYLSSRRRSTPDLEARLPPDVSILREPFTAARLLAAVRYLLT